MIIRNYNEVAETYAYAAKKGWVIPCICTENQTSTEAVLAAAKAYKDEHNLERLPVSLAVTINYESRSQAPNYNAFRDWRTGLRLFSDDAEALAGKGGLFEDIDVLLHLDHAQFDLDAELLSGDLSDYSSVMYDASALPFEQNIEKTAAFVKEYGGKIFIEGACDEIVDATGTQHNALTTPGRAKEFITRTGADVIVCNLGTEHRASGKELKYYSDAARAIKSEIGGKIVLHGTSSVGSDQIGELFADGVCKVNIWTAIERDSAPVLFEDMVKNAVKAAGQGTVKQLIAEGYLTEKCLTDGKISLSHCTAMYRNDIIFGKMKSIIYDYFALFCPSALAG